VTSEDHQTNGNTFPAKRRRRLRERAQSEADSARVVVWQEADGRWHAAFDCERIEITPPVPYDLGLTIDRDGRDSDVASLHGLAALY
jgi:hypothetical protein